MPPAARLAAADAAQTPRAPPPPPPPPAAAAAAHTAPSRHRLRSSRSSGRTRRGTSAWDWGGGVQVGFDDTSGGADGAGAVATPPPPPRRRRARCRCRARRRRRGSAAGVAEGGGGPLGRALEHSEESEHSTATTVDAAAAAAAAAVAAGGAAAPGHVALAREHSVDSVLSVVARTRTRRRGPASRRRTLRLAEPRGEPGRAVAGGGRGPGARPRRTRAQAVRQWESSAPLLKWEKEAMGQKVREKRPRAEPRAAPAGGARTCTKRRTSPTATTTATTTAPRAILGLGGVDMSALSELEPLGSSADDAAKRRRTWMTGF